MVFPTGAPTGYPTPEGPNDTASTTSGPPASAGEDANIGKNDKCTDTATIVIIAVCAVVLVLCLVAAGVFMLLRRGVAEPATVIGLERPSQISTHYFPGTDVTGTGTPKVRDALENQTYMSSPPAGSKN